MNTTARVCLTNHAPVRYHSFPEVGASLQFNFPGLATVANMGAEVGATTSTFPYTPNMRAYLHATARGPVAQAADYAASKGFLTADEGVEYDEVIEVVRD